MTSCAQDPVCEVQQAETSLIQQSCSKSCLYESYNVQSQRRIYCRNVAFDCNSICKVYVITWQLSV